MLGRAARFATCTAAIAWSVTIVVPAAGAPPPAEGVTTTFEISDEGWTSTGSPVPWQRTQDPDGTWVFAIEDYPDDLVASLLSPPLPFPGDALEVSLSARWSTEGDGYDEVVFAVGDDATGWRTVATRARLGPAYPSLAPVDFRLPVRTDGDRLRITLRSDEGCSARSACADGRVPVGVALAEVRIREAAPVDQVVVRPTFAAPGTAIIHPGMRIRDNRDQASCSLNWLYVAPMDRADATAGRQPRVFAGTAAHCANDVGEGMWLRTPNEGVDGALNDTPGTVKVDPLEFGTVVVTGGLYEPTVEGLWFPYLDGALIELHPEVVALASPDYPVGGGPFGVSGDDVAIGDEVDYFGHGAGPRYDDRTRQRTGVITAVTPETFEMVAAISGGDSGGPVLHAATRTALGWMSVLAGPQPRVSAFLDHTALRGFPGLVLATSDGREATFAAPAEEPPSVPQASGPVLPVTGGGFALAAFAVLSACVGAPSHRRARARGR